MMAALAMAGCAPKAPPLSTAPEKPTPSARLGALEATQAAVKARQDAQESTMLAMQERLALLDSRLDMIEYSLGIGKGSTHALQPPAAPMPQAPPRPAPHPVAKPAPVAKTLAAQTATAAKPTPVPAKVAANTAVPSPVPAPQAAPVMSKEEQAKMQKDFDDAMVLLKSGDYEKATSAMTAFIRQYPDAKRTPEARYWLGESRFAQMQVPQAVDALKGFESMPVTTPKRAPALFRLGAGYERLGSKTDAARAFAILHRDYPGSIEANNAARQLKQLGVANPLPPASAPQPQAVAVVAPAKQPWAVNVVSLGVRADAQKALANLHKQGIQAKMMKVRVAGKLWYRLRITGYASRAASESARLKIIGKGYSDAWVSPE
jgi:tol-pal system protein YbgF